MQPFLRKESNEFEGEESAESNAESTPDSMIPQNLAESSKNSYWILRKCVAWLIKVGRGWRTLLFAKAKSSKNFYALRARFCEFVESREDFAFFCVRDSAWNLGGIVESVRWILRFCISYEILFFKLDSTQNLAILILQMSKNLYFLLLSNSNERYIFAIDSASVKNFIIIFVTFFQKAQNFCQRNAIAHKYFVITLMRCIFLCSKIYH